MTQKTKLDFPKSVLTELDFFSVRRTEKCKKEGYFMYKNISLFLSMRWRRRCSRYHWICRLLIELALVESVSDSDCTVTVSSYIRVDESNMRAKRNDFFERSDQFVVDASSDPTMLSTSSGIVRVWVWMCLKQAFRFFLEGTRRLRQVGHGACMPSV